MFLIDMPRLRKASKPRKAYEPRVDLMSYQRLMRFLRWMSPELNATQVLRMLPQSDGWTRESLGRYAAELASNLKRTGESLSALVPWAVIGAWEWPTKSRIIEGHRVYYQGNVGEGPIHTVDWPGLPHVRLMGPALPWKGLERGEPVLLNGQFPTVESLTHLATDLRDILDDLCEADIPRIYQRWGNLAPPFPDFYQDGELRALTRLKTRIAGKVAVSIQLFFPRGDGTRRSGWRIEERPTNYDFAAYAAWLLVQLIRDGHAWRVTRCTSCQGWFLRVRRDPANRPAHFCSDECRRAWHNPRRGKMPKQSKQRRG
jgi:hypothetical protein